MKSLRNKYPLSFACVAAMVVVLCFSFIPSWDPHLGFIDYGTFRQTLTAAVIMAAAYIFTGEYQLSCTLDEKASLPLTRILCFLAVAAIVIGLAAVYVQGTVITPPRSAIIMFVVTLVGTAVFEEILFRGFFFEAFANVLHGRGVGQSLLKAALASSFLFGILHVTSDLGSLFRLSAYVHAGAKIAEGMLFGLVMCALYVKTHSVWPAVLAHFVFDVLSELPVFLATGVQKFTYITGSPADIMVLLVGCAILLPAAKWSWDYLSS